MKRSSHARPVIGIALFYATFAGVCQSPQTQPEIRFRLIHNTLIVVGMRVNGIGPFDFVLDTGTDITVVDESFASKLSLDAQGHVLQSTIGGRQTLNRSTIDTLTLGTKVVRNQPIVIEDLSQLRKVDAQTQGIAGQDFLSHFNYLLDYRRGSIRLEDGDEIQTAAEGDRVPMELKSNKMIVEAESQSARSGTLHLVLDSGASSIVLMGDASKRLQMPIRENRTELTAAGSVVVHAGTLQRLSVGSHAFHDIRAVISPGSVEPFGDGLLPTTLFQSLYINNHESFVILNPGAEKGRSNLH